MHQRIRRSSGGLLEMNNTDEIVKILIRYVPTRDHLIREVLLISEEDDEYFICKNADDHTYVLKKCNIYIPEIMHYGVGIFGYDETILKYILFRFRSDNDFGNVVKRYKKEIEYLAKCF